MTDLIIEFISPDYITTFTDTFKALSTQIGGGLKVIVPSAFGLFAVKYVWRYGKSFFTSLAK